jgi:NDP-sugar pyrophosphorylase family protein
LCSWISEFAPAADRRRSFKLNDCSYLEGDNFVKPNELYATAMEDEFNNWLASFDSLEALFASRHQLLARLTKQQLDGSMEDHTLIVGPVHVNSTSRVLTGAIIRGPAIIGPDATIGYGAKILDGSFIGAGSRVGPGAVVSQSIIMNGSIISENCVIQNAVVGSGVFIGAGALVGEAQSMGGAGAFVGDNANLRVGSIVLAGTVVARGSIVAVPVVRTYEERR